MESKRHGEEKAKTADATPKHVDPEVLTRIATALEGLRFGTVTIVVQDGQVVQIERNEKVRLR